jgi:WD40 repeat protein
LEGHTPTYIIIAGVSSLVVDESMNRLYSALDDSFIQIWDLETWTCLRTIGNGNASYFPCNLLVSPSSHRLYLGFNGDIYVMDTCSLNCVSRRTGHLNFIRHTCLSEDGNRLYSASDDGTIRVWDIATTTRTSIAKFFGHTSKVAVVCLSYKTDRLISVSDNGEIKVWDTVSGKCIHTVSRASRNPIRGMALSDQNNTLYLPADSNTIEVWHVNYML